jgi:hypothetical protein
MTRVVYLVLSHKHPRQVARLVRRLRPEGSDAHVVLHHDESASHIDAALLQGIGNVHRIPARPVAWGDFSHVAAILRGLRWARNHLDFDWLVLLSGQDYPIRPVPETEALLSATEFDGFVKGSVVGSGPNTDREGFRRYFYRYYHVPWSSSLHPSSAQDQGPVGHAARQMRDAQSFFSLKTAPAGVYVGVRRLRTPFSREFPCYRGSTWFTLSSRCVEAIDSFTKANPSYVRTYRRTRSAAESFIITILLNDRRFNLSSDHLRYIRFRGHRPNPEILTADDLDELLSSGKYFARKFDMDLDAEILDLLDERVHTPTAQAARRPQLRKGSEVRSRRGAGAE